MITLFYSCSSEQNKNIDNWDNWYIIEDNSIETKWIWWEGNTYSNSVNWWFSN